MGAIKPPHLLSIFVLDSLALRYIAYQKILHGFNASLNKDQNKLFPPYPLEIGMYNPRNCTHARIEGKSNIELNIGEEIFWRYDPK